MFLNMLKIFKFRRAITITIIVAIAKIVTYKREEKSFKTTKIVKKHW